MASDPDDIVQVFVEYYEKLLGQTMNARVRAFNSFLKRGPVLSLEQQVKLIRPYLRKEVKEAMFQIDKNKSPGHDDYGSGFYRSAWDIVGADITEAVLEFFENSQLLKQLNTTNIAPIPKVDMPDYAS